MTREFEGRVALVTGAASGIGRATAEAFAREGARVVVSDVDVPGGEATVSHIRHAGGDAVFVEADISDEASVERLVSATVRHFGRLDVAFNNAGVAGTQAPLADLSAADFHRVIAANLTGVFLCMKYQLAQMVGQGGGAIVNNASILGTVGFAGAAAYAASKHGVIGLTRTAALDYATKGIRVNAVCPGFIVTPMLEHAGMLADPAIRTAVEALHPVKRLGESSEVAEAVLFLASSRASFITGHPLLVDGGYVAL